MYFKEPSKLISIRKMKPAFLLTLFLTVLISLSIPSSFKELRAFSTDTSVSLYDFVESEDVEEKEEEEDESVEVEELEKDLLFTSASISLYAAFSISNIYSCLSVFISTYIFSIFIPPLA